MGGRWIALTLAGLLSLVVAGVVAVMAQAVLRNESRDVQAENADRAEAIVGAHNAIVGRLPEAQGITFGEIATHGSGDAVAVCGTADIREEQDEFDGPERFVFVAGELTLEETDGGAAVDQQWKTACG